MAGSVRARQKKLEKNRKKRDLQKKDARKLESKFQGSSLMRVAGSAPFGPCWVSARLDEPVSNGTPLLVSVVVTRRVRGQLLGTLVLVDRTCLGVKDANLLPLQSEAEVRDFVTDVLRPIGDFRECDPIEAQSVVFHALDYAASLGFDHHPDFEPLLVGPRPEALLETPLAHPVRPVYVSGPHDDVAAIVPRLARAVGEGNYDFSSGSPDFEYGEFEPEDEEEDVIETTAESS